MLKLVKCERLDPTINTEAEQLVSICREHPSIMDDDTLSFPIKIFSCLGPDNAKRYDLIVTWKAPGERLSDLIAPLWYTNQVSKIMEAIDKVGECLSEFHSRYGACQHGDVQTSNIFYDEDSKHVTFIDVGGMGVPTLETDQEHFNASLLLSSQYYGPQLLTEGLCHFETGYARGQHGGDLADQQ